MSDTTTSPNDPVVARGCPEVGELVGFYASLSEPADYKTIQETISSIVQDPNHNIFLEARTKSKELVGFLRAWTDAPECMRNGTPQQTLKAHGIVYEIAVRSDYRGKGVGKRLLADLAERTKEWKLEWDNWSGNPERIATNLDRGLNIIRTLYGVSLIFGFQRVVESSYVQLVGDSSGAALSPTERLLLLPTLAIVLAALGTRFFWAVGNIRRCVLQRIIMLDPPKRWVLVLVHFPLLFLHAVLFFLLCRFYQDICMKGLSDLYSFGFIFVYTCLLTLNAVWLLLLMYKRTDKGPERLWIANNAVFAILALISLRVFPGPCVTSEHQLLIASGLFLVNSVIDFVKAKGAYILPDAFGGG